MTLLHLLTASPLVNRLGWTLLHSLWEGAMVAGLLAAVLGQLRRARPEARYAASVGALSVFAGAVICTFVMLPAPPLAGHGIQTQSLVRWNANPISSSSIASSELQEPTDVARQPALAIAKRGAPDDFSIKDNRPSESALALTHAPVDAAPSQWRRVLSPIVEGMASTLPWLVLAWAVGVLCLSIWNVGGWVAARRLCSIAVCPVSDDIRDATCRLSRRMGLTRTPQICQSHWATSPIVVGAIKPVILLPASLLTGLAPSYLEPILVHELAHILRHDYLINLLQKGIEVLLFYHPATWWIGQQIRIERENCCDDAAVAVLQDRLIYIQALAALAECHAPRLAAAATGAPLVARIRRLTGVARLSPNPQPGQAGLVALATSALVMIVAIATFAQNRSSTTSPASVPSSQPAGVFAADQGPLRNVPGDESHPIGWLTGRLVDPGGKPIAGAKIAVEPNDDAAPGAAPLASTSSGPDGRFRLGHFPASYHSGNGIGIEAERFALFRIPYRSYCVYAGIDFDLGLIRLDPGRSFRGRFLDIDGTPLARQTVECSVDRLAGGGLLDELIPVRKLITDDTGRFHTPALPVGILLLNVHLPHRQLGGWFQPILPGAVQQDLGTQRLERNIEISGIVQDEQRRPIAGVRLGANGFTATTDTAGKYALGGFHSEETMQIEINKPGFVSETRLVKLLDHGFRYGGRIYSDGLTAAQIYPNGPVTELNIVMHAIAWIEGRAIDAATGTPVKVDRVVICRFDRKPGGQIILSSCRFPEFFQPQTGHFLVSYSAPAEYHLTVSATGYDDAEAFTPPVDRLQLIGGIVVKMKKQEGPAPRTVATQQLTGIVTRHGKPIQTGWIALCRAARPVNASGAYLMRGRTVEGPPAVYRRALIRDGVYTLDVPNPDDQWEVVVEEPGEALTQVGPISVAPSETKKLDIACTDSGSISGRVRGIPAQWAGHLWVVAFTRSGVRAECRVGDDERFEFAQLPPGEYGLKAGNDAMEDREIPPTPSPKEVWQRPADPWRHATVVRVNADRQQATLNYEDGDFQR